MAFPLRHSLTERLSISKPFITFTLKGTFSRNGLPLKTFSDITFVKLVLNNDLYAEAFFHVHSYSI